MGFSCSSSSTLFLKKNCKRTQSYKYQDLHYTELNFINVEFHVALWNSTFIELSFKRWYFTISFVNSVILLKISKVSAIRPTWPLDSVLMLGMGQGLDVESAKMAH